MTTLDDFRETLTKDPADWLVLADWLEERGDDSATSVRYLAEQFVHGADTLSDFIRANEPRLRVLITFGRCLPDEALDRLVDAKRWFDFVMALASLHVHWKKERERLLSMLDDECRQVVLMSLNGCAGTMIADRLRFAPSSVRLRFLEIYGEWRRELDQSSSWQE